ncbi:MAG: phage holin family protein [Gemmatimonadota bacterium]
MGFLLHIVVTAALILLIGKLVSGIDVDDFGSALWAALALGLVNAFLRPLAILFSLPATILTLGLFLLVINAGMLWLAAALVPGFRVRGFGAAFTGALLLSVFNWLVGRII